MRIFGVILAGGRGRRMGGADKASLVLGGRSLLSWVRERIEPQVEALALSANGDVGRFAGSGLVVLVDDAPVGPLAGVLAALRWAAPLGATHVVSVPVDTPFVPADLVPRLLLAAEGAAEGLAIAASDGRAHPAVALWPVGLAGDLAATLARGEARVMGFAERHGAVACSFPDARAFLNLNAPDDLQKAHALAGVAPC